MITIITIANIARRIYPICLLKTLFEPMFIEEEAPIFDTFPIPAFGTLAGVPEPFGILKFISTKIYKDYFLSNMLEYHYLSDYYSNIHQSLSSLYHT